MATNNYSVNLASDDIVKCNDIIYLSISVNKDFASTEISINYDVDKVEFNLAESTLGAACVSSKTSGLVKLVDFGEDKKASQDNYILAFVAKEEGQADFYISDAGFGTKESAVSEDLYKADLPLEHTVIEVIPKQLSILDGVAGLFDFLLKIFYNIIES